MSQTIDDATAEPGAVPADFTGIHPGASGGDQWFGHPRQLARLFTTEAMERFGYYGMRALLTLYLAQHFLFNDTTTTGIYGGFTALVYLTPLVGGLLADRFGNRQPAMTDIEIDRRIEIGIGEFLDHVGADDPGLRCAVGDKGRHVEGAHADQAHVRTFAGER